jgi:hypothetical protein
VIEARVDELGVGQWRLLSNRVGYDRDWSGIHHDDRGSKTVTQYKYLRNVAMRAHYSF